MGLGLETQFTRPRLDICIEFHQFLAGVLPRTRELFDHLFFGMQEVLQLNLLRDIIFQKTQFHCSVTYLMTMLREILLQCTLKMGPEESTEEIEKYSNWVVSYCNDFSSH